MNPPFPPPPASSVSAEPPALITFACHAPKLGSVRWLHTPVTLTYCASGETREMWDFFVKQCQKTFLPLLSHTAPAFTATACPGSCQLPLTPLSIPIPSGSLKHGHKGMQHPVCAAPSGGGRSALGQPSQGQPGPQDRNFQNPWSTWKHQTFAALCHL